MKNSALIPLIKALSLFFLTFAASSVAIGAGVAAIKEQTFHSDAGATAVAYIELKDIGGPSITINTRSKVLYIDRQKLAGKIEVLSALPSNIINESDLDIVRNAVKGYRDFTSRFPKSEPILANQIAALDACIKEFEDGKARLNGKWLTKEEALAMMQKDKNSKQDELKESNQKLHEKIAFAESQKAKGLVKYDGKWIPKAQAQAQEQAILMQQSIAEEKRRKAEEEYEEDGLVLLKKTEKGVTDEWSTTITGTVVNCTGKELKLATIEYKIYDASEAQIGSAIATITGLEADGRWNFKAYALKRGRHYKIYKLSGF